MGKGAKWDEQAGFQNGAAQCSPNPSRARKKKGARYSAVGAFLRPSHAPSVRILGA